MIFYVSTITNLIEPDNESVFYEDAFLNARYLSEPKSLSDAAVMSSYLLLSILTVLGIRREFLRFLLSKFLFERMISARSSAI
jgi:hypothetical protein